MLIKKVQIKNYKNLNIDWDLSNSGNIVTLLGKNASGKTNLLEALVGFSNVADNSKSISTVFKGRLELGLENGSVIWIDETGISQQVKIDSIERKASKRTTQEIEIPDIIRLSVQDDFAPRIFNAQRKFNKFNSSVIRFSTFNEIKYGDDFLPFLIYLFCFAKDSEVRKILFDEFGIEGLVPFSFLIYKKELDLEKLQQPTKGYLDIIKDKIKVNAYSEINHKTLSESDLISLSAEFGTENDFFEVLHLLMGHYYNNNSILDVWDLKVSKHGEQIRISDLSDGEKQLIYILAIMHYYTGKNVILLFDEPDTHIYPNLQMHFIDYLKKINNKMNIIIATHSPYIVSSLEKENVFYIYDGEIYNVGYTKGKDLNSIMREIFNTPVRPIHYSDIITEIYSLIDKNKISKEDNKKLLNLISNLENDLGENDPTIIEIKTLLQYRNYEID